MQAPAKMTDMEIRTELDAIAESLEHLSEPENFYWDGERSEEEGQAEVNALLYRRDKLFEEQSKR